MTLKEALQASLSVSPDAAPLQILLACGFTPLHLKTFLVAYLQQAAPHKKVHVSTGLFGDLAGTVESAERGFDAIAIALEWQDLDPRLGYRSSGAWGRSVAEDIVRVARAGFDRLATAIERLPPVPIAVAPPSLPIPPLFHTTGAQAPVRQLALEQMAIDFLMRVAQRGNCLVLNPGRLDESSPASERLDLKGDLSTGFPYSMTHADAVAAALACLLAPAAPKKGLITDLDGTLWSGIVGEAGPENVHWDLHGGSQIHCLYQKLLSALSSEGILIGVASKNDPAVARAALNRQDILLKPERIFPLEIHWQSKSESVSRILKAWNIAADSVVFVDDSPMELAEVAAAHPGIECLLFPQKKDADRVFSLLRRVRDLFGRPALSADDGIRLESVRQNAAFQEAASNGSGLEDFLRQADAIVQFEFDPPSGNPRVLELVNKTNQFNLNGIRITDSEWIARQSRPGAIAAAVDYEDKFGPLGTIAVIQGRVDGKAIFIEAWVMSCRAFSRRIEHQVLRTLFETFGAQEIQLNFAPTPRNGPAQEFFASLCGAKPEGPVTIGRAAFEAVCPALYHRVSNLARV